MALVSSSATAFPSSGRELILELKRTTGNRTATSSDGPQHLAPYNAMLVRACFQDLQRSFQTMSDEMQAMSRATQNEDDEEEANKIGMNVRPSILFHHTSIQRQKRCLLAYHKHRMDMIKAIQTNQNDIAFNNAQEAEFSSDYQELRESYAATVFELDSLPPTSHMVQVRVLENLGQVVLESGRSVNLQKGSRLYLSRRDVLEFLQAGSLELCDGEEIDF